MDYMPIFELIVTVLIFLVLFKIGKRIYNKIDNSESRYLNPDEYLPKEEIQSLKQVFYLIMMLLFFIFLLYTLIYVDNDYLAIAGLEIVVLLYVALTLDYSSWKNKILFLLLIPYGSISFLIFEYTPVVYLDILHVLAYAYLIKIYYDKFRQYTQTNSLGITIILLFAIIFISFLVTSIVEGVGPLNSLVMVSNAFTSNGYAILGNSSAGKLNALILVWAGYVLSGVGTATLTAAILMRHFNKKFDRLEELIKENDK